MAEKERIAKYTPKYLSMITMYYFSTETDPIVITIGKNDIQPSTHRRQKDEASNFLKYKNKANIDMNLYLPSQTLSKRW